MNKYEIMFVVRPDMEEAEIKATAEEMKKVLTDGKVNFVEEKNMGQRELAYEVKKFKTGYYFLYIDEANSKTIDEFDRVVRINEKVIRHIIVKVED